MFDLLKLLLRSGNQQQVEVSILRNGTRKLSTNALAGPCNECPWLISSVLSQILLNLLVSSGPDQTLKKSVDWDAHDVGTSEVEDSVDLYSHLYLVRLLL